MLVIESTDLYWDRDTSTFSVDASVLEMKYPIYVEFANGKWFLTVRSHRTGTLARFYRMEEIKNQEGELVCVEFANSEYGLHLVIHNE